MGTTNSSNGDKVEKEVVLASCTYDYVDKDVIAELATADAISSWYGGLLLTPILFFVVATLTMPSRMFSFVMEARLPAIIVLAVLFSSALAVMMGLKGYSAWYQLIPKRNEGVSRKTMAVGIAVAVIILLLFALVSLMVSRS